MIKIKYNNFTDVLEERILDQIVEELFDHARLGIAKYIL